MQFSVLVWNIWLENQINGSTAAEPLLGELKTLLDRHQPDYIGLLEVLQHTKSKAPFITDFMASQGYKYNYYAPASPLNDEWLIGAALYSKRPFIEVNSTPLSKDTPAERRGYPGHVLSAIVAKLENGTNLIVAHPMHLRTYTLRDHYTQTRVLSQLLQSSEYKKNTIVVGDFNETDWMPRSFKRRNRTVINSASGSLVRPTWRWNASRFTPVRANLDKIFWTKASDLTMADFMVLDSAASDHRPLFAVFDM